MRYILIFAITLLSLTAFGQRTWNDTLVGADTMTFPIGRNLTSISVSCVQVGDSTSDGTMTLYGSEDKQNWHFLNFVGANLGVASPQASITGTDLNQMTITNGLEASWAITNSIYPFVRPVFIGTANDTTALEVQYYK